MLLNEHMNNKVLRTLQKKDLAVFLNSDLYQHILPISSFLSLIFSNNCRVVDLKDSKEKKPLCSPALFSDMSTGTVSVFP